MMITVLGSETRTVELLPLVDSYVYIDSPENNYGKELALDTEYEAPKTIVEAFSFDVPPGSQWVIVSLPKNGKITGSFEVTEGGALDIDFWIKNEALTVAYVHESRVTSLEFSFVAPHTGVFYLQFDNSFSWFTSKTVSLSDVILTMDPFDAICSPVFLLFDLSSIPPEATINSANLSLSFKDSGVLRYTIVNTFYCSNNDWNEQTITYENAPFSQIYPSSSFSLNVSGVSVGDYCSWDVKPDVVRARPSGKLTEVIVIVDSEFSMGMTQFFSRETENKPKLEISYTYVSVSSSVSSSILLEGQSISINVNTDPSQNAGNVKAQYSTDKINWLDIASFSGGTGYYVWIPPVTAQIYLRGHWETSWEGGSYYSLSSVNSIYVIPIYLLVLIPVIIVGTIVGVYYWRKRKRGHPTPSKK